MAYSGVDMRDPFQGFDIKVSVTAPTGAGTEQLKGSFTGFMCRIVCQTEAYLPIGQRIPRMLDGEILVAWSLEQGAVHDKPITATFGQSFANGMKAGRQDAPIPRSIRFNINMETTVKAMPSLDDPNWGEASFNDGNESSADKTALTLSLMYARVDTGSFGMAAGKRVASSSWQGTAQNVKTTVKNAA